MPCSKAFTIGPGTCELETCTTAAQVPLTGGKSVQDTCIAYASDLCYCCVMTTDVGNTETYFNKYDPATNTLVLKATTAFCPSSTLAYDPVHHIFVTARAAVVVKFDPLTNVVTTFASGVSGNLSAFVYVPEKLKVYGQMGVDGSGLTYIGYLDLDLNTVVQLGTIPASGGSKPFCYNLCYVPLTDCIYGSWITGVSAGILKFNLATNTGSHLFVGVLYATSVAWDDDRSYLLTFYAFVEEVDVVGETIDKSTPCPANIDSMRWKPTYVSSLKKAFATGWDVIGNECILSYDTQTATIAIAKEDYYYYSAEVFKGGSMMADARDRVTLTNGVRRLCLT